MSATTSSNAPAPASPSSKVPTSVARVYDIPVVKDSIVYADSVLRSYSLSNAAIEKAEAIASTLYKKAGEPIQDKLQPQINTLDGLANKGLDYVQGKAPYASIFQAKTDDIITNARKPADQAYSTAKAYQTHAYSTAKAYQDAVSSRLHDTLVASQSTLGSLQAKLGSAAAHVPKSSDEVQKAAHSLYEQLEHLRDVLVKQSHDLPANVAKAVQPYVEKLQKGAGDVKAELAKTDVPMHVKAQHIIGITREITSETLHDALETLRAVIKPQVEAAGTKADGAATSAEQFVQEHTPGDQTYAEVAKS